MHKEEAALRPETETHHDTTRRAISDFLSRVVDRIDDILDLMDRFSRHAASERRRLREVSDLPAVIKLLGDEDRAGFTLDLESP